MRCISLINIEDSKVKDFFYKRKKELPSQHTKKCVIIYRGHTNSKTNIIGNNIVILDSITKQV